MPATRTQIWDSTNKIKSHTSTERDALFVSDGHMVYNSEDDEMQGYDGSTSSWVSLTLPDGLCPDAPAVAEHTHDGYAATDHEHMTAPEHTHDTYADVNHIHQHADINHEHDDRYALTPHFHDETYAPLNHKHFTVQKVGDLPGGYIDWNDPSNSSIGSNGTVNHTLAKVPTVLGIVLTLTGTAAVNGYAAGTEIDLFGRLRYKVQYTDTARTLDEGDFNVWVSEKTTTTIRVHVGAPTVLLPNGQYADTSLTGKWRYNVNLVA
ncbi:MAG: hypothetical protein F4X14_19000 [Caldilineaceae bacterium SB0661_bin_32]|uniref:Uncharacterized protein n=1 Tax=Caldilineaceae bacterium SB0661_bin_32 TaxID=2605255 RepID=A0A6B1DAV1_9CHLR|nr:hypothetical protein [Caldilineaceae bacterium SB0661_bin_32]